MTLAVRATLIAAFAATAASAAPAPEPQKTPAPPAKMDAASLSQWVAANIAVGDDMLVGASASGVSYLAARSAQAMENGHVAVQIRFELYKPTTVAGGLTARSILAERAFDCQAGQAQTIATSYFPFNNLQGEAKRVPAADAGWAAPPPNSISSRELAMLCAAFSRRTSGSAAPPPEPQPSVAPAPPAAAPPPGSDLRGKQ